MSNGKVSKERIIAKLMFELEKQGKFNSERGEENAEVHTEKASTLTGVEVDQREHRQHSIEQGDT